MAPTETASMIQIEKPAPPAIVAELHPVVIAARAFKVIDIETHAAALERIKRLRAGEKGIEDHFARSKKAASDAHKEIVAAVNALIGPIAEARRIYDAGAAAYEQEERRKADEEQRRLQEKARREEEERQLAAAQEAQDRGDTAEAEAIVSEQVSAPVITVQPQVAKVEGVSNRTTWSAEVHDLHELVKYVATHPEWISLLEPAMPNLNRLAVAQQKNLAIPGVRAVSKTVRATR
jgi:hypothetical protein